ncbi:cysteine--tRNA ligase [uncultured Campylobacter sp.]|uniref:cysteine--tRNA ligase n=1 Tax=uncultured Campylobacter sp. TaxID=218934 RepID=UPI0025E8AD91|nr:cysteine--tRNA ligase [uncultured Campylobacter sp.]
MQIFDSVKRKKVEFEPVKSDFVRIYVCGPTVYDDAHLGHAKSAISFDLLRRTLSELGYKVKFVRNYTDIDDKILKKMSESGESLEAITDRYIASYERDMNALNVLEPDVKPKATQTLKEMIGYIEILLKNGFAYEIAGDGVYFDTAKDAEYLSLSGKFDTEANVARVESNLQKEDKKDFVLWKFDEKWYESPFGRGRPGWHTECIAMIKKHLSSGENFEIDIHAGGLDLLFPHHENEAAQCRCAEHKSLAKYWLHNGFIQVNNEKMSKSLGNSFFVKDALERNLGEAVRFYLISSHYRANFNFSEDDLNAAKKRLDKIYRLKKRVLGVAANLSANEKFKSEFMSAMSDDLNTSKALASVDEFVRSANDELDANPKDKAKKSEIAANLELIARVLGILQVDVFEYFQFGVSDEKRAYIEDLINQRNEAKAAKNYELSDKIRDMLAANGISLMDTPNGCMWEKI